MAMRFSFRPSRPRPTTISLARQRRCTTRYCQCTMYLKTWITHRWGTVGHYTCSFGHQNTITRHGVNLVVRHDAHRVYLR